jgi:NADPH:quinone reductase-like Zn-dependent oxidoreductase
MRRGNHSSVELPFLLGSNLVGIVHQCGAAAKRYGIRTGMRVAAIVPGGAHAKFVTVSASKLMIVPSHLDASDVACLLAIYLPAFQTLHHGRTRPYRYARNSLKNRTVLITNGSCLQAQAMVRLAHLAGAKEVILIAPRKRFESLVKLNASVLEDDPEVWLPVVEGEMDVVIDLDFPNQFEAVQEALTPKGRLVCSYPILPQEEEESWIDQLSTAVDYYQLIMMKRATLFDFCESAKQYPMELKEDFKFLLNLLHLRQIRPHIESYVKLIDVPMAHIQMETEILTGAIVCEPWKE